MDRTTHLQANVEATAYLSRPPESWTNADRGLAETTLVPLPADQMERDSTSTLKHGNKFGRVDATRKYSEDGS